ncbi:iron uptake transporter permease EfeU [Paracoccus denitrificans]|jgi:high-affinity iron transporter|nr:iron uptake transporter permease EfeU [Paracoccus denitrificans]MBB4629438.1 high-affinity iron transporter [Paracoccus denitrificans]MCU7430897.1 FTR1 family iron permease [Paracoccus denitrificans]QAR25231.1 FTR1 family iron permease [Paracoccus denitrificans]UPV94113.1 FTR1 family iron permease [Paracoccus denitrificans]WQO33848.1 iron uptake transporter permease EfeU [Paracoccus denitrificans]
MLAPFLIMLREGLEAALIVGIIAGYLRQTGRRAWLPAIWVGVFLAVAMSLFAGAAIQLISSGFPQRTQELFEAVIGLVAVAVLVGMVFWMRRAARSIKAELHSGIDEALAHRGGAGTWALIGMVFLAVAREGLESVFFLLAIFQQSRDGAAPIGALLGVIVAIGAGWGIYAGALRLDLRRFFRWTGVFILLVAAGLLAGSVRALHEAGLWNGLQDRVYDLSLTLPESGPLGTVLSGLLGYREAPTLGEALVWGVFLAVTLVLFLRPQAEPLPARPQTAGRK